MSGMLRQALRLCQSPERSQEGETDLPGVRESVCQQADPSQPPDRSHGRETVFVSHMWQMFH
ncbi:unnamed protein product [Staurois parvus]|uniref:Uncharacterized protein n=1 Tax=Staurois parvus TaxID=386267 RepID=A0ABN9GCG1_9NEOB|nr:unnamed protein product [Staurois parvus]